MVKVYPVPQPLFLGQGNHLLRLGDFVGYRFLAQDRDTGVEQSHRRFVVVAAIFDARGANACDVDFTTFHHR